jgi:hypothetical protein
MYQPAPFHRRDSLTRHPPYGLFLDPHRGQHNWTAASSRLLVALLAVVASIVMMAALGPH